MNRRACTFAVLGIVAAVAAGCSTYRSDLDRATSHYNNNEYEQALALLEVLERDRDSLSMQEQAQYAYYRGMTHFRLNEKRHARHWLGVATSIQKESAGALSHSEEQRAQETLTDLNRTVYGIGSADAAAKKSCKTDADCSEGQFCDDGACQTAPGTDSAAAGSGAPAEAPRGSGRSCGADNQCPGDEVCLKGTCFAP